MALIEKQSGWLRFLEHIVACDQVEKPVTGTKCEKPASPTTCPTFIKETYVSAFRLGTLLSQPHFSWYSVTQQVNDDKNHE
jgi:hypothetical protein